MTQNRLRKQTGSLPPIEYRFSQISEEGKNGTQISGANKNKMKWLKICQKYCSQILKGYPQTYYSKEYAQYGYVFECEASSQFDIQGNKWLLFKTDEQVQEFEKRMNRVLRRDKKLQQQHRRSEQAKKNPLMGLLNIASKAQTNRPKQVFTQFIQQMLPKDKWNLKVLGQFSVRLVEVGGLRNCLTNTVCKPCRRSANFVITITTQNILLSEHQLIDGQIQQAIPFTNQLEVSYNLKQISHQDFTAGIKSGKTYCRVSFKKLHDLIKFAAIFNQAKEKTGYFKQQRFQSFSFPRQHNWVNFYADGESYFNDVHDAIQRAEKKICMTGWCFTPYFLLKRPQSIKEGKSRLDRTLLRAAERGVKIFIMVYQEPSLFVNNDSYHVFDLFQNMHENFKVLRHPGLIIPQLWSHHEKSVIIDQKIGFMGGLDICYGRWDNHQHSIHDYNNLWDGADYKNQRQRQITQPRKFDTSNLDRQTEPRMPWHDIALQIQGPSVIDMQRHFVQYWYFAIRDLSDDPKDHLRNFHTRYQQLLRNEQDKKRQQQRQQAYKKTKVNQVQKAAIEYTFFLKKVQHPQQNQYTFEERAKSAARAFKDLLQHRTSTSSKQIFVQGFVRNTRAGKFTTQLCRSSCSWSTGIKKVEHSIYNAYLKLIQQAKNFIYIENQFFMSHQNDISQILAERIQRAYRNKQKFNVVVVMPLMPGFQGDVTKESSGVLRVQMQLQFQAITRHQSSIYQILKKKVPSINVQDYISFYGLRGHSLFGKEKKVPKTQIIYVHSKFMIVDDQWAIIGSANINDRSLLGSRDSQLAMIINEPGSKLGQGKIFDFRVQVFKQHFAMSRQNCKHINSYYHKLRQIGQQNALIYRKVFGCIPDNIATKFEDVKTLQQKARPELYETQIRKLIGHYVEWPIDFLKNENLSLKFGQKEFLAPLISFT